MQKLNVQTLVMAAGAPEIQLPETQPLTLTRNFAWVVVLCVASLLTVPMAVAWTASFFLN